MIRVGTDCSGIEAPIQALMNLGIPFSHEFSSEIDPNCIKSIKANYHPKIIYTDMTSRNAEMLPDIDIYICGFPCQPFSLAGKRSGTKDKRGRIFEHCLQVIKVKKPAYFILENVKGLLSCNNGRDFNDIINALKSLDLYNVYWRVLNTADYGLPQHRERLFIIGILSRAEPSPSCRTKSYFEWPASIKCQTITSFVDRKDCQRDEYPNYVIASGILQRLPARATFVDMSFVNHNHVNADRNISCITTRSDFWCIPLHRKIRIKELLKLQGFPPDFNQAVSNSQLKKQIGNSMSVCVLEAIFKALFESNSRFSDN